MPLPFCFPTCHYAVYHLYPWTPDQDTPPPDCRVQQERCASHVHQTKAGSHKPEKSLRGAGRIQRNVAQEKEREKRARCQPRGHAVWFSPSFLSVLKAVTLSVYTALLPTRILHPNEVSAFHPFPALGRTDTCALPHRLSSYMVPTVVLLCRLGHLPTRQGSMSKLWSPV